MTERPILMSAQEVMAILRGGKTQTRRPIKPQPDEDGFAFDLVQRSWCDTDARVYRCPFGVPGDKLWCKETHLIVGNLNGDTSPEGVPTRVVYRATNDGPDAWVSPVWRPSIHMPKWASRITLEVERVWVERVQDISEADCQAEGIRESYLPDGRDLSPARFRPRELFRNLWNSINGPGAWGRNDWIWACEFRPVT